MTEWRWPDFIPSEFLCPCCKTQQMDPGFLDKLQALRKAVNHPLHITSGYRCPKHNERVSKTGLTGPHTTGRAADLKVSGGRSLILVYEAVKAGMTGVGVSQKGPHATRFVHVDDLVDGHPRPWLWSY